MIDVKIRFLETPAEYCLTLRQILNDPDMRIVKRAHHPADVCSHFNSVSVGYVEPYEGRYGEGYKVVITRGRSKKKPNYGNAVVLYVTDGYYYGPDYNRDDDIMPIIRASNNGKESN